jgi:predicted helicase
MKSIYPIRENANWKLNDVRKYLKNNYNPDNIIQYCYRPFDARWAYFDKKAFGRPRKPLMDNMLHENLGLMLMREYFYDRPISNFFVVNKVADSRVGLSNRGSAYLFPLYLYQKTPSPRKRFQFNGHVAEPPAEYLIRVPNLSEKFIEFITQKYNREFVSDGKGDLKKTIGTEDILAYIYAVLYSKNYRERYHDFLKTDFPKIPFADFGEFKRLSELGSELISLHTMKHPSINETTVKFPIAGENIVKQVRYDSDNKRVFINDEQYFEGIEESLWNYLIGGYQVLDRWLKYRIGRSLDNEDIIYFMKIAKAIEETIKIEEAL